MTKGVIVEEAETKTPPRYPGTLRGFLQGSFEVHDLVVNQVGYQRYCSSPSSTGCLMGDTKNSTL